MKSEWCWLAVLIISTSFSLSSGHGRLLEPPSRSSLWRFPDQFPDAEANYDDNGLNCGGRSYQHFSVGGKCGICGDKWTPNAIEPRPNEAGGRYAKGIITRHYRAGALINVTIEVTASHKGYFEFRICPNNDVTKPATQQCLDKHLLRFHDGTTKFYYGSRTGFYQMQVRLPANVTCSQCVFQWKWTTGNSWGVSPSGQGCVGCGPQEEFYGCSDISIGAVPGPSDKMTTTQRTTESEERTSDEQPSEQPAQQPAQQPDKQPGQHEQGQQPAQQPAQQPTTRCRAVGVFAGDPSMDNWCALNCKLGNCPATRCSCDKADPPQIRCKAVGVWSAISGMAEWCQLNCQLGYCPASHCLCD